MPDYAKMKNADLETLLKERSLPHTGKKAELVARLVEDDKTKAAKPDPATTSTTPATAATSAPAAAAVAAGGTTRANNPIAVPNQKSAIDPANTDDLSTNGASEKPTSTTAETPSTSQAQPTDKAATTSVTQPTTTVPATDFTSGLPSTDVDAELEKRKKRAAKFGLPMPGDVSGADKGDATVSADALKALERAKRFGITATGEAGSTSTGSGEGGMMSRLDGALPDRSQRRGGKRGSDAMLDSDALEDAGLKRHRGKRRGGGGEKGASASSAPAAAGAAAWMSEADRAKAQARKNRFAAPAASS